MIRKIELTRELAKCVHFDVGVKDHAQLYMHGHFDYDGAGQGFGLIIDPDFIVRFLAVFRVDRISQVNGKPCWITHDSGEIFKIEPLFPKDGETFDVQKWKGWLNT